MIANALVLYIGESSLSSFDNSNTCPRYNTSTASDACDLGLVTMPRTMALLLVLCTLYLAVTILWDLIDGIYTIICAYKWREAEYPVGSHRTSSVVFDTTPICCNTTAQGIFSILTGIPPGAVKDTLCQIRNHAFDVERPAAEPRIHYLEFKWSHPGKTTLPDGNYHALVYSNGLLYQSYRTSRYYWPSLYRLHLHTVAYPTIQTIVSAESDRVYFEKAVGGQDLDITVFNRLCAPRSMPVAKDVRFVCLSHYTACIDPFRTSIALPLMRVDPMPGERDDDASAYV